MDIVTQGLLGASLTQAVASKQLRAATAIGFLAGLLPDADALIRSSSDPLLFLEYHRHFTHSLVFVPLGAAVAALLLWPFFKRHMDPVRLYGFALLGYALSGALDACTSYGTYLWWPFSSDPVAWSIIAIVDPAFSLTLLVAVTLGYRLRLNRPARMGLLVAGCYLGVAAWQHSRVEAVAETLAATRGHTAEQIIVKPTLGNILLWRSLYVSENRLYADAIRQGVAGHAVVYEGESRPLLRIETLSDAESARFKPEDLSRFARFSGDLLVRHPGRALLIGDARFSMLPTSLVPLWGIEPGPHPSASASFVSDRKLNLEQRRAFLDMLTGRQ